MSAVLVLNAGSSSLKFAVFEQGRPLQALARGSVSRLGHAPRLSLQLHGLAQPGLPLQDSPMTTGEAAQLVFAQLEQHGVLQRVDLVGHRIVHGGRDFVAPALLDGPTLQRLQALAPLAPLHQPANLEVVALAAARLPQAAQVGAFDTAFHAQRPWVDRLYALPRALSDDGILAYGFHGLSYQHAAKVLRERDGESAGGRTVVAHLGSGASLCAMRGGASVATSMGFSALDGLPMGSRCGALDPGVVLHLIGERGMDVEAVTSMLYQQSGLLGLSGISSDMQVLLSSEDPRAYEAVEVFVYRTAREIASLAGALSGLDTLVFTAGIGENAPEVRRMICEACAWMGVRIDPARNASDEQGPRAIGASDGVVEVLVLPTDEELAVAEQAMLHL